MEPIVKFPEKIAKSLQVIFCDIDDTVTSDGKLLPESYNALWLLQREGIHVVPITGRCAGYADMIARFFPVRGCVAENGALYLYMDENGKHQSLKKRYFLDPEIVKESKKKFEDIKREVFQKFPTTKLASDQPYREFDLAIDYCEDVPPLDLDSVQEIVKIYEKYGAKTKVSSIHVNGWFGEYDKLTMTKLFTQEQLGFNLEDHKDWAIFIGDSPNDQPMFDFFPYSIGVANINKFINLISQPPKYVTNEKSGLGFVEMVDIILKKRRK